MEQDLILKDAKQLPATIEELKEYILIGKAKLKAYEVKVKLIKNLNLAKSVKDQALQDGQDVGEAILWAEAKLGELVAKMPDFHSSGRGTMKRKTLPEGMSRKESHEAQTLAKHPDEIKETIKEAKEKMDLPTRSSVLKKIEEKRKVKKDKPNEQVQMEAEFKEIVRLCYQLENKVENFLVKLDRSKFRKLGFIRIGTAGFNMIFLLKQLKRFWELIRGGQKQITLKERKDGKERDE